MTPAYKVIADGVNITAKIETRLMQLTVSDAAGMKSDAAEIRLDDRENDIELPAPGASLSIFMGYKGRGLVPVGVFTVDEVAAKGAPDTVTIRARAAHMGGSLKSRKTRNRDEITLEDIAAKITPEHSLKSIVSPGKVTWVNTAIGGEETVITGEGSPVKKLRQSYSTKDAASRAAEGKLAELNRGNHTFSVTTTGNPLIAAEGQIEAIGFRQGVSGRWSVKSVRHQITGGGFTTSVQAEKPKITGTGSAGGE